MGLQSIGNFGTLNPEPRVLGLWGFRVLGLVELGSLGLRFRVEGIGFREEDSLGFTA